MVKKTIILLVLYFFLQIYLTSLRRKKYFAKEPEPGVFGPWEPEPEPLEKKYQEPEPEQVGNKIRSRSWSRLTKKSGAGAAKKFAGSPALEDRK